MARKISLSIALVFIALSSSWAQQRKPVTLDAVWQRYEFFARRVPGLNWMKDSRYYTAMAGRGTYIIQYEVATGKAIDTIFNANKNLLNGKPLNIDGYTFSASEGMLLLETESEPIYRRSSKSNYYIFNRQSKALNQLSKNGKQSYATFNPTGSHIAFCRDNDLFVIEAASGAETTVTTTGEPNKIINGSADWVYEEEFEMAKAFDWNADGTKIAYQVFNEEVVPEYNMQLWTGLYPTDYRYKYPKAGEKNANVGVSIYDLITKRNTKLSIDEEKDQYIPRVKWTRDPNLVSIIRLNRLQNRVELLHAHASTGKIETIIDEKTDTYHELPTSLYYLSNGKQFIWTSDKSGFKHAYLCSVDGKKLQAITSGNWEIDEVLGVDEKTNTFFYTSTETSPMDRMFYSISLNGKKKKLLTQNKGTHNISIAGDFKHFIDEFSSLNTPPSTTLFSINGKQLRVLEDNAALKARLETYAISPQEFFTVKGAAGDDLNGWMIKPQIFDPNKKYPVLFFVYGGPGHQTVLNNWGSQDFMWYQTLANEGYIIVSIDPRGTGGRGSAFKKSTYAQLGKYECEDVIAAAKNMGNFPYVDKSKMGIWGWSFGGYLTALCMVKGDGIFSLGMSVAPVTNWRFYDTIYTERYLKTPQDNPSGYDDNSPINFAADLKGKYLLVHGTGDDNVHVQNAIEFQNALIAAGKQYDCFYYPNRNHGIYGGNTRYHLYVMLGNYLKTNMPA